MPRRNNAPQREHNRRPLSELMTEPMASLACQLRHIQQRRNTRLRLQALLDAACMPTELW